MKYKCSIILVLTMLCSSLSVRGMKSDSAVLCTSDESFEMKEAETSNSLLLLPQCQFTAQSLNCCAEPSAINRQVLLTLTLLSAISVWWKVLRVYVCSN